MPLMAGIAAESVVAPDRRRRPAQAMASFPRRRRRVNCAIDKDRKRITMTNHPPGRRYSGHG